MSASGPSSTILPGRLGNLTPEQQEALDKFRTQLQAEVSEFWSFVPERHDDATLLRFLRARKWDLVAAKKMIQDTEKWRRTFQGVGVDELVKNWNFPQEDKVNELYPQYYHKTDKDGRPVYIEVIPTDFEALARVIVGKGEKEKLTAADREAAKNKLLQRLVVEYERFLTIRLPATSKLMGYPVETSCTILDIGKIGLTNFSGPVKEYVQEASSIGQNYYPECMGKFYILNTTWIVSTIYKGISYFLDPVTQSKISLLTTDEGPDALVKQIPIENLPSKYTKRDPKHPDQVVGCQCPGGCASSNAGPWNETEAPAPAPAA